MDLKGPIFSCIFDAFVHFGVFSQGAALVLGSWLLLGALGAVWDCLGALLGRSRDALGPSWPPLGHSWATLGALLDPLGTLLGPLGSLLH